MKKSLFATFAAALGVAAASAQPAAIYINNAPVNPTDIPPHIDAVAFLNRSIFDVSTFALPFQAQSVDFWTNNGAMSGSIGFLFERDSDGTKRTKRGKIVRDSRFTQLPSAFFHNEGQIAANSIISVRATNMLMSGRLDGAQTAAIRLDATNGYADLGRGGIRVGPSIDPSLTCSFFSVSSNFFSDPGITDLYWGGGRNNGIATNEQSPLNLQSLNSFGTNAFSGARFDVPFAQSPFHQVIERSGRFLFTNSTVVGSSCSFGNYSVFVHTVADTATSSVVNVVFVPTNSILSTSNFFTDVRFYPTFGRRGSIAYAPVVEFRNVDFDIVNRQFVTNYVTLVDASAGETNITLARPFATVGASAATAGTRRPSTYTWIKGRFCSFDFAEPANAPFDPGMFYSPLMTSNTVDILYAASQVQVGQSNSQSITTSPILVTGQTQIGLNPGLSDPTNFAGHVSIFAKELNLASTHIKSEDYIGIHTDNLVSNTLASLDAPFIDFDVRTTNTDLVISNVAPAVVNRLVGTVAAWSGVWDITSTNTIGAATNLVRTRFHVLIVDSCLQSEQPVTINRFTVHSPNTVIHDTLRVNAGLLIDTRGLTIQSNASIVMPVTSNFAPSNVLDLLNFTNYGTLNLSAAAYFGTFEAGHVLTNTPPKKRRGKKKQPPPVLGPLPLDNFINHGAISASSVLVRSTNFVTSGRVFTPATLNASGGVGQFTGSQTIVSNAEITATSDVEFHGDDLHFASTLIRAGNPSTNVAQYIRGALVIDATNSLGDFETRSTNDWFVSGGVRLPTEPVFKGDFLGTRIYSSANALVSSTIVWPAENRGATPEGFSGNLALGRLVLDGLGGNLFRFKSATESNAIYVDFLELRNDATNFNFAIGVDPDFTIYFADCNLGPERLAAISGGRLQWVSSFAGPQSSTNLTYPNGVTYTFNAGLVRSLDIDSDNDTVANGLDCTPIPVPGFDTFGAQCSGGIIFPAAPPLAPNTFGAASLSANISELGLAISLSSATAEVTLQWNAPAGSTSTVEYAESLGAASWHTLTNLINGPENTRLTVKDAAGAPLRVYRVRVDAVKQ